MKQLYRSNQLKFDSSRTFQPATLCTYSGHASTKATPVIAVAWSPHGQRIASAGADATVQVWDATTGQRILTYSGHAQSKYGVDAVAWSPAGIYIASMSTDNTVHVWDAATGCRVLIYHPSGWHGENSFEGVRANAVAWSPDGDCLAVAGRDGRVRVLQVEQEKGDCDASANRD